jgi:hypothetical protein
VKRRTREHLILLPLVLAALFLTSAAHAEGLVIVPYGSEWRYAFFPFQGSIMESIPPDVETIGFDDSGWALGTAPFGLSDTSCIVDAITSWDPADYVLVIRKRFLVPNEILPQPGCVDARRHTDVWAALDDEWGAWTGPCYCPWTEGGLACYTYYPSETGEHVLVMASGGGECDHRYLDGSTSLLLTTGAPQPEGSWGVLKALFLR